MVTLPCDTNCGKTFKMAIFKTIKIHKLSEKEKAAIPCVMECIEILFVAYFIGMEDTKQADAAYDVFRLIQNCTELQGCYF